MEETIMHENFEKCKSWTGKDHEKEPESWGKSPSETLLTFETEKILLIRFTFWSLTEVVESYRNQTSESFKITRSQQKEHSIQLKHLNFQGKQAWSKM